MSLTKKIVQFVDNTLIDLGREFRWSYLPPLMVYVAAGISGLTGIVGTFFVKDYRSWLLPNNKNKKKKNLYPPPFFLRIIDHGSWILS